MFIIKNIVYFIFLLFSVHKSPVYGGRDVSWISHRDQLYYCHYPTPYDDLVALGLQLEPDYNVRRTPLIPHPQDTSDSDNSPPSSYDSHFSAHSSYSDTGSPSSEDTEYIIFPLLTHIISFSEALERKEEWLEVLTHDLFPELDSTDEDLLITAYWRFFSSHASLELEEEQFCNLLLIHGFDHFDMMAAVFKLPFNNKGFLLYERFMQSITNDDLIDLVICEGESPHTIHKKMRDHFDNLKGVTHRLIPDPDAVIQDYISFILYGPTTKHYQLIQEKSAIKLRQHTKKENESFQMIYETIRRKFLTYSHFVWRYSGYERNRLASYG